MRLFRWVTGRSDKYRLHLQKSKTKSTDSTHRLTDESKVYSVDEPHGSKKSILKSCHKREKMDWAKRRHTKIWQKAAAMHRMRRTRRR